MMGVKEETKDVIEQLIGPVAAEKVEAMDASNPKAFLDECKGMVSGLLGDSIAESKLGPLYSKYS